VISDFRASMEAVTATINVDVAAFNGIREKIPDCH
jgi:hypothetical protein